MAVLQLLLVAIARLTQPGSRFSLVDADATLTELAC